MKVIMHLTGIKDDGTVIALTKHVYTNYPFRKGDSIWLYTNKFDDGSELFTVNSADVGFMESDEDPKAATLEDLIVYAESKAYRDYYKKKKKKSKA